MTTVQTRTVDLHPDLDPAPVPLHRATDLRDPVSQAYWLLRVVFVAAPILFGLDKFTGWLTDWDRYLAPQVADVLHLQAHTVMYVVGAIEIVAGLIVAFRPRFGSWLVVAWLAGIIVNLLVLGDHYDVALRDVGLLVAALALAQLARVFPNRLRP